jgi:multidrug transporter EmrE-like cation transporter
MFFTIVLLAAVSFSIGGYFMKLSNGLTVTGPTLLVFMFFLLGAALQTIAMRNEQMTVTYVVVLGLEAVTAFLLGTFFLAEGSSLPKIAGIGLVLAGIMLLRFAKAG